MPDLARGPAWFRRKLAEHRQDGNKHYLRYHGCSLPTSRSCSVSGLRCTSIRVSLDTRVRPVKACLPMNRWSDGVLLRFVLILNADLRQPVAQRIAREAQEPGRLTLVAVGAPQGLADHFVFPRV